MSNIKVGEYCRDINGEILQVENMWLDDDRIGIKFKEYAGSNTYSKEDLKRFKHSKNIIDLIEVGDYVNGEKALIVNNISKTISGTNNLFYEDEIKSIVTKEQYKEMEYRIDE